MPADPFSYRCKSSNGENDLEGDGGESEASVAKEDGDDDRREENLGESDADQESA